MSLQPNAIDLCQTSSLALRARRRSSIRSQNLLPPSLLFSPCDPSPNQNESAVADELPPLDAVLTLPPLSPVSDAHVSAHSLNSTTTRHHDTHSTHKYAETASPVDSATSGSSYFEFAPPPPKMSRRTKWRLASSLFLYFLNGWSDGVTGTALPYFQAAFHLSYMTSSLLFVGTMTGFTIGTLCVPYIINFLSRFYLSNSKMSKCPISAFRIALSRHSPGAIGHSNLQARYYIMILASFGSPTFFILMGSKIGLPAMFVAYVALSSARSVLTAPLNIFLAQIPSRPLGYAYASWGLGAVVSPLIFQLTAGAGLPWTHFYFGSLVLSAASAVFLSLTFVPTAHEWALDRRQALAEAEARRSPSLALDKESQPESDVSSGSSARPLQSTPNGLFRRVCSMRYLWALVFFGMMYCASETTTQGLIVQYLLAERSANPNTVGYVSSGFWAGETTSRIAWSFFSARLGPASRKYIVQGCLGAALSMQLFIWFIKSDIENSVSGSLVGLFYGPLWPAILELCNELLPEEVKMIAMAIVSAAGSMGSAIFPFITGIIVTNLSMRVWSYMTVTQTTLLFVVWPLFWIRRR